jgi:hypothetical protein
MYRNDLSAFSRWLFATTAIFVATIFGAWTNSAAQTTGYHDFSYSNRDSLTAPTGSKPESKVWFNDNTWWAIMFNPSLHATDIYKLDSDNQTWTDTGTPVDDRPTAKGDALWDQASGKLYIVSNIHVDSAAPTSTSSNWGRLYRYTYHTGTSVYSLDSGFPVTVTKGKEETLVVAKDSQGILWVTYVESSKVMLNHSNGSDNVWGTPFVLPVGSTARSTESDDISTIIAFGGNKIGIFWSNQNTKNDYFSIHQDGAADTAWSAEEIAIGGGVNCTGACADDHINIKADSAGKLYVASKTSFTNDSQPLINLLVRSTSGAWSRATYSTHEYTNTRGIVLLDEPHNRLYFFVSSSEAGGNIDYKVTSMSSPSFVDGNGDVFIDNTKDPHINNATSTKQNITSSTGFVVLASDDTSNFYVHNFTTPSSSNPPTISSFTPTSGSAGTSVVITGKALDGTSSVQFNGADASFTVNSSTKITATVPDLASTGPISVTTVGGAGTSGSSFSVKGTIATISSISPTSGIVGDNISINGTNFDTASAVKFNGTDADFTANSSTKITATVPAGATTGKITVTNAGGTATSGSTFTVKPSITSLSPSSGPIGTAVIIHGTGFTGATAVKFTSGKTATFNVDSDTQITTAVPSGAKTGTLTVTAPAGTLTSPDNFTVTAAPPPAPVVASFTPKQGAVGTTVTITGSNFAGATSVSFNTTSTSTITVKSDTQITANVPAGATTGLVSVTTPLGGTGTSSATFTVTGASSTRIKDITFENGSITDATTGFDTKTGTVNVTKSSPIKGADSMTITAASSYGQEDFTATDELFITLYMKIGAVPAGQVRLVRITDQGTSVGALTLETTGKLTLRSASTNVGATAAALKPGTVYRIGIHQKRGTGSNAVLEGFLATGDAAFTTAFAKSSTQTFKTQADSVQIGASTATGGNLTFDDIRLDTGAMPGPSVP